MSNEKGNFRGQLFGGFNRKDVVNYIEKLAQERNMYKEKYEALSDEMEKLKEQPDSEYLLNCLSEMLSAEDLEDEEAGEKEEESKKDELEQKASEIIDDLQGQYKSVKTDMNITVEHVKCELSRMKESLERMSEVFDNAEGRFSELRSSLGGDECENDSDNS